MLGFLLAQNPNELIGKEAYLKPAAPIMEAATAPWWRNVSPGPISPDGRHFIITERPSLAALSDLAKPWLNLGGLEVDVTAERARGLTTRGIRAMRIFSIRDQKETRIQLPAGVKVSDPSWSPDGSMIAFFAHFDDATRLYVADPKTGRTRPAAPRVRIKPTLDTGFDWVGNRVVAVIAPEEARRPERPAVSPSPHVQVNDGVARRIRTYPSVLANATEANMLEYYATSQIALIDPVKQAVQPIGKPAMIDTLSPSPGGKHFRLTLMERPFSYLVPMSMFGRREVVWDETGKQLLELDKRPMTEGRPDPNAPAARRPGAPAAPTTPTVNENRRSLEWRPDGNGFSYLQLAPADRANPQARRKDRVMQWLPPFRDEDRKLVWESDDPITSVRYGEDPNVLFVTQTVSGRSRLSMVKLPEGKVTVLVEPRAPGRPAGGNTPANPPAPTTPPGEDEQAAPANPPADPGTLIGRRNALGAPVVLTTPDGTSAFLSGTITPSDPNKEGPKPWIDRISLTDGKRDRLFEGKPDVFESPTLLGNEGNALLVTRQTPKDVPNTFFLDLAAKTDVKITDNKDYLPDLTQARRETITVTRADGFRFQVVVTFPAYGYRSPAFFWFYPSEFEDQAAYDRSKRVGNKNLFRTVSASNKAILIRAGYVVVEPDCPIVGPAGRMNDGYVSQLRNNLSAVIDELDRRNWVDRQRLGIGGHSYGAFSTAHAMIATPFFRAGIAGAGNYNRTLTPFGFQSEGRQLWEGREMYQTMSPILYAEQLTGAILLYHGMEDQNIGTHPINSERFYDVLTALGKPASLVMYPYEDHGQIAEETVLDQWARFVAWLDRWLKNPAPAKAEETRPAAAPTTSP